MLMFASSLENPFSMLEGRSSTVGTEFVLYTMFGGHVHAFVFGGAATI